MTTTTSTNGRLCNQIIRNLCVSLIAQKHNLCVEYSSYDKIKSLGIDLFIGTCKYENTIILNDDNFFEVLNLHQGELNANLNPNGIYNNGTYFQTKEITNHLYTYLHQPDIQKNIITMNPFKNRFLNNKDCFIHIRLTDVAQHNPGYAYYAKALAQMKFDNLYIASDDTNHAIIKQIVEKYPQAIIINYDEIMTLHFAMTTRHIILSHGSF